MSLWFTSDTHFGHDNIIKYCNRPFASGDDMNEAMIRNWNAVVSPDDEIWHLGDFAFRSLDFAKGVVERLNGRIHLVRGNHDRTGHLPLFASHRLGSDRMLGLGSPQFPDGVHVELVHDPARKRSEAKCVLHGHVHEVYAERDLDGVRYVNVGQDVRGFRPMSLDEVLTLFARSLECASCP